MILTCPNCSTRFRVNPAAFGNTPRVVKCAKCAHSWTQAPTEEGGAAASAKPKPAPKPTPAPAPAPAPSAADLEEDWDVETGPDAGKKPKPSYVEEAADDDDDGDGGFQSGDDDYPFTDDPIDMDEDFVQQAPSRGPLLNDEDLVPVRPSEKKRKSGGASKILRLVWLSLTLITLLILVGAVGYVIVKRDELSIEYPSLVDIMDLVGIPVDPYGIDFLDVSFHYEAADEAPEGVTVLVLAGKVINTSEMKRPIQPIRVDFFDKDGNGIYYWTFEAKASEVDVGGSVHFSSRLPEPPKDAADMRISFEERAAGMDEAPTPMMQGDETSEQGQNDNMSQDMGQPRTDNLSDANAEDMSNDLDKAGVDQENGNGNGNEGQY